MESSSANEEDEKDDKKGSDVGEKCRRKLQRREREGEVHKLKLVSEGKCRRRGWRGRERRRQRRGLIADQGAPCTSIAAGKRLLGSNTLVCNKLATKARQRRRERRSGVH